MEFIHNYPDSTSTADFASRNDEMIVGITPFRDDYAAAAAIGATGGLITTTSTTSNSITLAQKTLVLVDDIDLLPDMFVTMAYTTTPTNYVYGRVDSYVSSTKTLIFTPWVIGGSGSSLTTWTITVNSSGLAIIGQPQSEIMLNTGNGNGGTDARIRRYSVVSINTGTDMTYDLANEAANGARITINTTGLYKIAVGDANTVATDLYYGVTVNESGFLTAAFSTVTNTMRLITCLSNGTAADSVTTVTFLCRLVAADIVRCHNESGASLSTSSNVRFHIQKVGS